MPPVVAIVARGLAATIAISVMSLPAGALAADRYDAGTNGDSVAPSSLSRLMTDGGVTRADAPLPPEQAFRHLVTVLDPFNLRIEWIIEAGYYLYRDSLAVTTANVAAVAGAPAIPVGTTTRDEHFGETQVFYAAVAVDVPLFRATPAATPLPLVLEYQGCKTDSICYPPQVVELVVDLPATSPTDPPPDID